MHPDTVEERGATPTARVAGAVDAMNDRGGAPCFHMASPEMESAAGLSPLRIALVTETYAPEINGVAMTLGRLSEGLRARGHALQLVCPQRAGRAQIVADVGATWLPVLGLPLPGYSELRFGLPAGRRLRRLWEGERPDVAYVATEGPLGWAALREARRQAIPVVSGFHTNFHTYSRHYKVGWLENTAVAYLRGFHNQTAATLVPTPALQHDLQQLGFRNVAVLSRGVDSALYDPARRDEALRRTWGLSEGDLAVMYVGRIAPEKNLGLAVRAFREIEQVRPGARFVLVGEGPSVNVLRSANPDFVFCGAHRGVALASHYASGDLFLFPSQTETFGNVILEALASGLALVAYNQAAARVCMTSGENGILAEPGDELGFVAAARRLAADESLRAAVQAAARVSAQAVSWPQVVGRFEQLLRSHIPA